MIGGLAAIWWSWVSPTIVPATVVLAAVAIADFATRGRVWPQVRLAVWALALAKLALPPIAASPVSVVGALPAGTLVASPAASGDVRTAAFGIWIAGVAAIVAIRALRARGFRRAIEADALHYPVPASARSALARASRTLGLRKPPRLVVTSRVAAPAVFGALRPIVLLPANGLGALTRRELGHALLHEAAHVRRRDLAVDAAARAAQALFWFHPLAWLARRRVHALLELCCDATVADALRDAGDDYRRTLLRAAERSLVAPRTADVMSFGTSAIVARLRGLEHHRWRHAPRRRASSLLAAAAMLACVVPAARMAAPRVPDDVADARRVVASALAGQRESCFRIREAVFLLANEKSPL